MPKIFQTILNNPDLYFPLYLAAINVLILIIAGVLLARRRKIGAVTIGVFIVLGGPLGLLLAYLLFDGHINKENAAAYIAALGGIVAWGLVVVNLYGPTPFSFTRLTTALQAGPQAHLPLLYYLAGVNLLTLLLFCIDKLLAIKGKSRIPEFCLLGFSFIGGSVGGILGMLLAHHKTSRPYFALGLPCLLLLDLAVCAYLMQASLI